METIPSTTLSAVFDHVEEREIDLHAEQHSEPEPIVHDVTTLHATGEMISETPADPVEVEAKAFHQDFAPVSGETEEEIVDDEEDFHATLHASAIEEIDDLTKRRRSKELPTWALCCGRCPSTRSRSSGVERGGGDDDLEEEDTFDDPVSRKLRFEEEDEEELEEAEPEETVIQEEIG